MLRLSFLALLFSCGFVVGVAAQDEARPASTPAVRKEIIGTIDGQLAAFRKKDITKAFAFSAAALRAQKPLPIFVAIVRASYPEIWANTHADYGIVRDDGETATVVVRVYAKDSNASYDYTLVREPEGWRIEGVLRHDPSKEEKV